MQIGAWYNSVDETLQSVGLPLNRKDGEGGSLMWQTTGKKSHEPVGSGSHPMAYCMATIG